MWLTILIGWIVLSVPVAFGTAAFLRWQDRRAVRRAVGQAVALKRRSGAGPITAAASPKPQRAL
jgi:hypothetical protein